VDKDIPYMNSKPSCNISRD